MEHTCPSCNGTGQQERADWRLKDRICVQCSAHCRDLIRELGAGLQVSVEIRLQKGSNRPGNDGEAKAVCKHYKNKHRLFIYKIQADE